MHSTDSTSAGRGDTYEASVLNYYAETAARGIHAGGAAATDALIDALGPKSTDSVLDVGCGSGHTLALLADMSDGLICGIDANPSMLETCGRRLRFCGIADRVKLVRADVTERLPFGRACFDKICVESVLGFQSTDGLIGALREISRVLKPGGRFIANETLWLADTDGAEIAAWNERCVRHFGMIQANPMLKGPNSLKVALVNAGFDPATYRAIRLANSKHRRTGSRGGLRAICSRLRVHRRPAGRIERRSVWYSRWRRIRSAFHPGLLRYRLLLGYRHRQMRSSRQLMQGYLIIANKA